MKVRINRPLHRVKVFQHMFELLLEVLDARFLGGKQHNHNMQYMYAVLQWSLNSHTYLPEEVFGTPWNGHSQMYKGFGFSQQLQQPIVSGFRRIKAYYPIATVLRIDMQLVNICTVFGN